jgi:chemotaxis protein histidine kinase CheA
MSRKLAAKKPRKISMHADHFEIRLARVRHRFATTLEGKIRDAVVSADHIAHGHGEVVKQVTASYRDLHAISGIGPTVGFAGTGEAAHAAEGFLLQALREQRGLTEREVISLKKALERLRVAATSELRSMFQRGG